MSQTNLENPSPSNTVLGQLEEWLGASGAARGPAFTVLIHTIKDALKADEVAVALDAICRTALPDLDYTSAQSLARLYRRAADRAAPAGQPVRVAVLGSSTTDQLSALLDLYLFAGGVSAEIYESDFGVFRQEILDPDSGLYTFNPNTVFLATGWRDLGHVPGVGDTGAAVSQQAEAELEDWSLLWQTMHDRIGCQVIQNNFDRPAWRTLGNYERGHPAALGRYIDRVNAMFHEQAPPFVTLHDIDHLSAAVGRWAWGDERFYHHAKMPCAPECLVNYAHSVAALVCAQSGMGKKCLVLDLDNTLWGGVIGDDGLGGILLGQGDAESEVFLSIQQYVKGLCERGVILAVCSKNEEAAAREVFERHPEMVLALEDISCFVANWDDKATNLRHIAAELNIGLNALVLLDDNPVERALVRQLAPEVAVPELPEDAGGFVQALEMHRYFEVTSLGAEDLQRTEYYRANTGRKTLQRSTGNVDDFLASLNMTARIAPIQDTTLERSVQLINRSNQFNLTTRRYTIAEILAMVQDDSTLTRTVSLVDRFGDNGLISVLVAKTNGDSLEIDTWLMSCRVLKRGVEHVLLNHLCRLARDRGLKTIRGEFIPTAKNTLVRNHFAELGFTQTDGDDAEHTHWELELSPDWKPLNTFIEESDTHG